MANWRAVEVEKFSFRNMDDVAELYLAGDHIFCVVTPTDRQDREPRVSIIKVEGGEDAARQVFELMKTADSVLDALMKMS